MPTIILLFPPSYCGQKRYEQNCQIAVKKDLTVISETKKKGKNEKIRICIVTTRTTNPRNYIDKMSAGPIGSYAPSFISRITVPLSRALNVCH